MYLLNFIIVVVASFSFIPKLKSKHWSVRSFDFFRIQLLFVQIVLMAYVLFSVNLFSWIYVSSIIFLLLAIIQNARRIYKFTPLHKVQVPSHDNESSRVLKLLTANILQTNESKYEFVSQMRELDPDFILMLEVDDKWAEAMLDLEPKYPYTVGQSLDNLYGILLLSKYPLHNSKIRHIVKEDIPSIDCEIEIEGKVLRFFGVHPEPPSPTEQPTSEDRDAELLRLASEIKNIKQTTIVAGDLNDVVWSKTSEVFVKESGLFDPRVGRGLFATFNAKLPRILRFPVDQLFHTKNIHCKIINAVQVKGSDHLGINYHFSINQIDDTKWNKKKLSAEERLFLKDSKRLE